MFSNVFRYLLLGNLHLILCHVKKNMDRLKIGFPLIITIKIGSVLHISFVAEIYVLFPPSAENGHLK